MENFKDLRDISDDFDNGYQFPPANHRLSVNNHQRSIAIWSRFLAVLFAVFFLLPFLKNNFLTGQWALAFVALFLAVSALVVGYIFGKRADKLDSLISGQNLLAQWKLSGEQKQKYADSLFERERARNKLQMWVVSVLLVIIFGFVMVLMDEGRLLMLGMMISLIVLVGFFAWVMPQYYRNKNASGDGHVLVGKKFVYVNGYFHNWDFPLSGIREVKYVQKPFAGLYIAYYYTDRTFKNTEELVIPIPESVDLDPLIREIKR